MILLSEQERDKMRNNEPITLTLFSLQLKLYDLELMIF